MNWKFSIKDQDNALEFYRENGFVGYTDLLSDQEIEKLHLAFDEAVDQKKILIDDKKLFGGNDAVYFHPEFENLLSNERLINIMKPILGDDIELQHSKLNSKPMKDEGGGVIEWHQDYPFFPHTNLDLIAIGIHFDDEDEGSGSMRVIPRSHKLGVLSHTKNGIFDYKCTADIDYDDQEQVALMGKAGLVTVHDSRILHTSGIKTNDKHRRLLVFQCRSKDNKQLSGVVWKCFGYDITGDSSSSGYTRFMDGSRVENRGEGGRLYDLYGKLAPSTGSN